MTAPQFPRDDGTAIGRRPADLLRVIQPKPREEAP